MTTQLIEGVPVPNAGKVPRSRQLAVSGAVAAVLVAAWPWTAGQFVLHLAILACINIVIVNGISLIDRCGQLSFGHSAPVALGAYGSVLFSSIFGFDSITAAVLSLVVGA